MPRTKILHLITRLDLGGSSENTLLSVINLDKDKYEITLASGPSATLNQGLIKRVRQGNISLVEIKELRRPINIINDIAAFFKIYHLIRKERYIIVHTHTSKAGVLGRLAAKLAGVPIIIHAPHGHIFYGYYGFLFSRLIIVLEKFLGRFTDRLITLTILGKKDHLRLGVAPARKIVPIYSGVEIEAFAGFKPDLEKGRLEWGIPYGAPVIGTVSRLEPIKGNRYFLASLPEVIKVFPDLRIFIVGKGSQKERLMRCAEKLGISEKVIFIGKCDDPRKIVAIFDIFILASLNEGMGRCLLEAQALGIPVIATAVGGVPEVVKDGVTGILVPSQNSAEIARAIIALLKDRPQREKLAQAARRFLGKKFSLQNMVAMTSDLYQELLREKQ